ncbi:hypothetical protein Glove_180g12 [Diversispora epigaea]|uniref:SCA7 domain-containing protein n=1 Tax=Diversispora epigaea TaxID=1348612 RepID=A0A397IQW9_9GLOM|nr:hypothetical protein Glove_180g12 [Diversispora epigaea]
MDSTKRKSLVAPVASSLFKDEENWNERESSSPNAEESIKNCSSWNEVKEVSLIEEDFYGCSPLKDENGTVKCNECSKKLLPQGLIEHAANCEKAKANSQNSQTTTSKIPEQDNNTISTSNTNKKNNANTNTNTEENYTPNKKRKISLTSEDPLTKKPLSPTGTKPTPEKKQKPKKEKEKKKTTGRNKGPIDLDKQCGVILPPNTTPCTRSLTCKSHAMALKRSVQGRSKAYDILLAQYQKKAIGRPQNNGVINSKQENGKNDGKNEVPEKDDDPFNSEEEVDAVMEALMCSKPQPLVTRPDSYVSSTSNYFIYKDMLPERV